jgi:hypothetical protein
LIASANEEILALLHELLKYLVCSKINTQPLYRDCARAILPRSSSAMDLAETKNLNRASMPVPVCRESITRRTGSESPDSPESPEEGLVLLREAKTQLEASEVQVFEMRAAIDGQNGLFLFINSRSSAWNGSTIGRAAEDYLLSAFVFDI